MRPRARSSLESEWRCSGHFSIFEGGAASPSSLCRYQLDTEVPTAPPIPLRAVAEGMGGVGHEDYYPRLCDCLGGVAMIVFGVWDLYILIRERVAELRLRDYLPPIQTIAVGLVLIGLARALQLLLVIFHTA
jgi:hypothetical protein